LPRLALINLFIYDPGRGGGGREKEKGRTNVNTAVKDLENLDLPWEREKEAEERKGCEAV